MWSITGWPHLFRKKTNAAVAAYDRRIMANLEALGAQQALRLGNYSIYRIDRATVQKLLESGVRTTRLDFGNLASQKYVGLGWGGPTLSTTGEPMTPITGYTRCPIERCATKLTKYGIVVKHETFVNLGELMLRVDRVCDHRLTFAFTTPSFVRVSINGFSGSMLGGKSGTVTVPASSLRAGVNVLEVENLPWFATASPSRSRRWISHHSALRPDKVGCMLCACHECSDPRRVRWIDDVPLDPKSCEADPIRAVRTPSIGC